MPRRVPGASAEAAGTFRQAGSSCGTRGPDRRAGNVALPRGGRGGAGRGAEPAAPTRPGPLLPGSPPTLDLSERLAVWTPQVFRGPQLLEMLWRQLLPLSPLPLSIATPRVYTHQPNHTQPIPVRLLASPQPQSPGPRGVEGQSPARGRPSSLPQ